MNSYQILVLNFACVFCSCCEAADESIAFLVLGPYGGTAAAETPNWKAGPAVIPAVRLAVDRINNRTDVLKGYRILLLEGNSGCQNEPTSAYGFVSNIFYDGAVPRTFPSVVGVIGPGCSESAVLLGTLGARDDISLIQISPAATSPLLTDTVKYRNTFRTLSTALQHVGAVTQLMALNSWQDVAVLYDHSRLYFRITAEHFLSEYSSLIGFYSEIDGTNYPLEDVEAKFKVIIVFSWFQFAAEMVCLAYHHQPQIIFPVYQWIFVDSIKDLFVTNLRFAYNGQLYDCSMEMMKEALEGSIFTNYQLLYRRSEDKLQQITDVDLTLEQYHEFYEKYLEHHLKELEEQERDAAYEGDAEDYAVSYYDATWALTLALNASLADLPPGFLLDYRHGQPKITEVIRRHFTQLKFEGLMGRIIFQNSTHDPSSSLNIFQCIDGNNVLIGVYNGTDLEIYTKRATFVEETFLRKVVRVHPVATAFVFISTAICTLYTSGLHLVFVCFKHSKSIKATSVVVSQFMFSGCYLILLRLFLVAVVFSHGWETNGNAESYKRDVAFGVVCNVSEWLNSTGISLVMATLCGKMWRIYRIFNHFNTRRYFISDSTLTMFIVVVVTVNLILHVLWTTVDPLLAIFEQQGIDYDGGNEPIIIQRPFCHCSYFSVWISMAYAVILSLVTCVMVLSLLNRRINRRYFQTAKSVNVMIYLLILSYFLGIVFGFVFESLNIHYTYISWQLSLLSIVGLVDLFMFSPPVWRAIKANCHSYL